MHLVNSAGVLVHYLLSRFVLPMTVLSLTDMTPAHTLNVLGTTLPVLSTVLLISPKLVLPHSLLLLLFLLHPPLAIR